ncbi:MAG: beta strand repeat-containing protein, partial [Hyphomicrobiaceae bacterium]
MTSSSQTFTTTSANDSWTGGRGNDTAIYNATVNTGDHDVLNGGAGNDTLVLQLTRAQWFNTALQQDLVRFLAAANRCASNSSNALFEFSAFDLDVRGFEAIRIIVDGVELSARDDRVRARDDRFAVAENGTVSGNVVANDSTPDLVRDVHVTSGPSAGSLVFNPNGTFAYSAGNAFDWLAAGQTTTVTFRYAVTDADLDVDTATVTITITGTNDGPVIAGGVVAGEVREIADNATGENATTHVSTGQIAFTDADRSDTHTVSFVVEGSDYLGTFTIALAGNTNGNHGHHHQHGHGHAQHGNGHGNGHDNDDNDCTDGDGNDGHHHQNGQGHHQHGNGHGYGHHSGGSCSGTGPVNWQFTVADSAIDFLAAGETREQRYTVTIRDSSGATTTQVVTITLVGAADGGVNVVPETNAVSATGNEDTPIAIVLSGSDADGAVASFQISALPANGTLYRDAALTQPILEGGSVSATGNSATVYFRPNTDFNGTVNFQYAAVDTAGAQDSSPATAAITITPVNDAPVLVTAIGNQTSAEDAAWSFTVPAGTFTDVDNATLTLSATLGNGDPLPAWLSFTAATGTFAGTPPANFDGDLALTVTATDAGGLTAATTFTLDITPVNDAAVIGAPTDGDVTEDVDVLSGNLVATGAISVNDGDAGQSSFQTTVGSAPGNLGVLSIAANGSYTYTVANSAVQHLGVGTTTDAVDSFTLTSFDGTTANVSFTIHGTNDAPVIGEPVIVHNVTGFALEGFREPTGASSPATEVAPGRYELTTPDAGEVGAVWRAVGLDRDFQLTTRVDLGNLNGADGIAFVIQSQGATALTSLNAAGGDHAGGTLGVGGFAASQLGLPGAFGIWIDTYDNGTVVEASGQSISFFANGSTGLTGLPAGAAAPHAFTASLETGLWHDLQIQWVADTQTLSFTFVHSSGETVTRSQVFDASLLPAGQVFLGFTAATGADTNRQTVEILSLTTNGSDVSDDLTESDAPLAAAGAITFTDIDANDTPEASYTAATGFAVTTNGVTLTAAQEQMLRDAFAVTAAGTWSFNLASPEYLDAGDTVVATYTIVVTDDLGAADTQDVTITLHGSVDNGAPVLTVIDGAGALVEGSVLSDSGSLTFIDGDVGDTATTAHVPVTAVWSGGTLSALQIAALQGGFAITPASFGTNSGTINWSYAVAEANIDFLRAGQSVTLTYSVTVTDGLGASDTQPVTVVITGTNDIATISVLGTPDATVIEDADLSASGSLRVADADFSEAVFQPVTAQAGLYGTFSINALGDWSYTLTNGAYGVQSLAGGQPASEVFTVLSQDGTASHVVGISLTGSNDGPIIVAGATAGFAEQTGASGSTAPRTLGGALQFTDIDLTDTGHAAQVIGVTATGVTSGLPSNAALLAMLTTGLVVSPAGTATPGAIAWNFTTEDRVFDFLPDGQTVTLNYTVEVRDLTGAIDTDTVTVTVTGTNDVPVLSPTFKVAIPVGHAPVALNLIGSGPRADDPDAGEPTITVTGVPSVGQLVRSAAFGGGVVAVGQVLAEAELTSLIYVAGAATGASSFTFSVNDGHSPIQTGTVLLETVLPAAGVLPAPQGSTITGTATGGDILFGGAGTDIISGLAGNDLIRTGGNSGTSSYDSTSGGGGTDQIFVNGAGYADVRGDDGDDLIDATGAGINTARNTFLAGGIGNDTIIGSAGVDFINGGDNNDIIAAGAGNDTINGDLGTDTIDAGAGDDTITSGAFSTTSPSQGPDFIDGGADLDRAFIYRLSFAGVHTADFSSPAAIATLGDGGTVTGVEQVSFYAYAGTAVGVFNDVIVSSNAAGGTSVNFVDGGVGDDTL